jgi:hypothetical protein
LQVCNLSHFAASNELQPIKPIKRANEDNMTEINNKHDLKLSDLGQFIGTENWYRHPLNPRVTYTDGVKYLADHARAYWLLDKIALSQHLPALKREEFQVWQLRPVAEGGWTIKVEDGNGGAVYSEKLDYSDFPLSGGIDLWLSGNVIMLPSEY